MLINETMNISNRTIRLELDVFSSFTKLQSGSPVLYILYTLHMIIIIMYNVWKYIEHSALYIVHVTHDNNYYV